MKALTEIISWMKKRSTASAKLAKEAEAELLALRAELATAKARAKTAEENWHKNEARIGKLQAALYDLFQSCSDLPFTEMDRMEKEINAASFALRDTK